MEGESFSTFPKATFQPALLDLFNGLKSWRIWLLLGWNDIQIRYRRSQLGPFWITLNISVTVYMMGLLYSHLFKMDLHSYYPYLTAGLVAWTLISNMLLDSTQTFISGENFLKQIKIPFSLFVLRTITRNFIIFFHNILAVIPVIIWTHLLTWQTLAIIPGLLLIAINSFTFGLLLAIFGSRYRDVNPLISSVIQILFFLTPILWDPSSLPQNKLMFVNLNPVAHYIDLIRSPLLGKFPSAYSLYMVIGITVCSACLTFFVFAKARRSIVYWL